MKLKTFLIFAALLLTNCVPNNTHSTSETTETQSSSDIRVTSTNIDAAEPAVASTSDGIFVVWVEHETNKAADVFLQKFDANGKILSEKTRVNSVAGRATAWRGDQPTIAVAANNTIYVGWTERIDSADENATNIILSVSHDNGRSFAKSVKVNDDSAPAVHGMHSLAVDKQGNVFMAWLDERYLKSSGENQVTSMTSNFHFQQISHDKPPITQPSTNKPMQHSEANREVYFAVSKDCGSTSSPNKKLASEVCPCCKTAVSAGNDGQVYVAWRQVLPGDFRHIAIAALSDTGKNFESLKIVSDDHWQLSGCPVSGPSLVRSVNGQLKVAWFTAGDSGTSGIYEAESSDTGRTFSPRRLISAGKAFGTPILISGTQDHFSVIWSANEKLYTTSLDNQTNDTKPYEIGRGELPAATFINNRMALAFVKKDGEKRGIWLKFY